MHCYNMSQSPRWCLNFNGEIKLLGHSVTESHIWKKIPRYKSSVCSDAWQTAAFRYNTTECAQGSIETPLGCLLEQIIQQLPDLVVHIAIDVCHTTVEVARHDKSFDVIGFCNDLNHYYSTFEPVLHKTRLVP